MKTELIEEIQHYEQEFINISGNEGLVKTLRVAACRLEQLETMASLIPEGVSLEDSSAHIIFNYSQEGGASTQTRFRCPRCRRERLCVRYHEDRLYGVMCYKCRILTLVKAGNPFKAAEIVSGCANIEAADKERRVVSVTEFIEKPYVPESCADCAYWDFRQLSPGRSVAMCTAYRRLIPNEDKERPDWCPFGERHRNE